MFSLRRHARNKIHTVAVGAAASLALNAATRGADLSFDPGLTPATPSGGTGTFSNSTANFSNGASDVVPTSNDDLHFGAFIGGTATVTIDAGTIGAYNVASG